MLDTSGPADLRWSQPEGGGRVLMELTEMEQRYDAVLGVVRDGLTGNSWRWPAPVHVCRGQVEQARDHRGRAGCSKGGQAVVASGGDDDRHNADDKQHHAGLQGPTQSPQSQRRCQGEDDHGLNGTIVVLDRSPAIRVNGRPDAQADHDRDQRSEDPASRVRAKPGEKAYDSKRNGPERHELDPFPPT